MTAADLAAAQLLAYNAHDIEAFVACYAEDVHVLDAEGQPTLVGREAFRAAYARLFTEWHEVGAAVDQRLVAEPHVIDLERWWRVRPADGQRLEGTVLARYTVKNGLIATVQFFRAGA